MTCVADKPVTPLPVSVSHTLDGMGTVCDPAIDAVAWDRKLPHSVRTDLDTLAQRPLPDARIHVDATSAATCLRMLLQDRQVDGPAAEWLARDGMSKLWRKPSRPS